MGFTVYLTIDDAPSPDFREKVDFLAANDVPAIVFCRGDYLEERPASVIHAIREGLAIGNHAYSHTRFSNLSLEEGKKEIRRTEEIIDGMYSEAGEERPAKLFRFPYGDKGGRKKARLQTFLAEQGFTQPSFEGVTYGWFRRLMRDQDVYWTFDVEEWRLKGEYDGKVEEIEDVLEKIENPPAAVGGSLVDDASNEVVLLHDHKATTEAFLEVMERLLAKDIAFAMPELGETPDR